MRKIIYLSTTAIMYVESNLIGTKLDISKFVSVPLKESTYVNGVVISRDNLLEAVKELKEQTGKSIQKSSLVIDSSSIITKKVDIPLKMNKQMVQGLPKMELSHATEIYSDVAYDVEVIKEGKEKKALCCALDEKVVTGLVDIFKDADIGLHKINIALMPYIGYGLKQGHKLKEGSVLYNFLDGDVLHSLIFEQGNLIFSARNRLFEDNGSESFITHVQELVTGLLQFQTSSNSTSPISKLYFYGGSSQCNDCLPTICTGWEIPYEIIQFETIIGKKIKDKVPEGYVFPLYSFFDSSTVSYNLIGSKNVDLDFETLQKQKKRMIEFPGLCLLIVAVLCGNMQMSIMHTKKECTELTDLINSAEYQAQYTKGIQVMGLLGTLSEKQTNLQEVEESINDGHFDSRFIFGILNNLPSDVTILGFSYGSGVIELECVGSLEVSPSKYVQLLRATNKFSSIEYESRESAAHGYNFSVRLKTNDSFEKPNFSEDLLVEQEE